LVNLAKTARLETPTSAQTTTAAFFIPTIIARELAERKSPGSDLLTRRLVFGLFEEVP
jgi:hypothetical protein